MIHAAGPHENWDAVTLFTTGLSDIIVKLPNGRPVATELSLSLPLDWPLDEKSLQNPDRNWPIRWIERIVCATRDSRTWPDRHEAVFMYGDPPQPLAEGTHLCGWLCLESQRGNYQMPDYRYIEIRGMFPIYAAEQKLIAEAGGQTLVRRFQAHGIPQYITPDRPNMADEQFAEDDDEMDDEDDFDMGCEL